jgi:two-component system, OmpR family, alkaline phosphatase synthesis response regulator PhoP
MDRRIILCDDEIHILRAVEFKLKKAGYELELAGDGEEAWEAILRQKPHLLITDCQMPRLNGLDLVRRIRNNMHTANIPVFMVTAKGYELSPELLFNDLKVLRVIAKPFSPRELLQNVNAVFESDTIQI